MAYTIDELLKKIDDMTIYSKDYPIIKRIIDYGDVELTAAITEEVIKGNLYWSDFEEVFPSTEYSELLEKTFKSQDDIKKIIERLVKFRSISSLEDIYASVSKLAIPRLADFNDKEWDKDYKEIRDDLLYNLLTIKSTDNELTIKYKETLLNYIANGKAIIKHNLEPNELTGSTVVDNGEEYVYINPDDILLSPSTFFIPVDEKYQIITEADRAFMEKNNISEDEMRKIKGYYAFIKHNDLLGSQPFDNINKN